MKISKIGLLVTGVSFILFVASSAVSAYTVQDTSNDVAHWAGYQGTWGWTDINVEDNPDVDIKELRQSVVDGKMVIELEIYGTIQNSSLFRYWFTFNTSDSYYLVTWSNGVGGGLGMDTSGQLMMPVLPIVTTKDGIITATFDMVGTETDAVEFWGYVWQYTTLGDIINSEWWGDWAPNTYQLFDEEDILDDEDPDDDEPGGDDSDDDKENGNDNGSQGTTDTDGSPGFGVIVLIVGLIILIFISKRKK